MGLTNVWSEYGSRLIYRNYFFKITRMRRKIEISFHKFLIIFFACLLAFDYYDSLCPQPPIVRISKPKFSLLSPYDSPLPPTGDVYNQLIDLNNFSFLRNPQPCNNYPAGLLLMVLVSSRPSNYQNRMVIRNTWGRSTVYAKVLFLLGQSAENFHDSHNESAIYGDIVLGNFKDAYRNMTYKHVMGLKWIAHHCPTAKYVLKTDDDIVVNSLELRRFLVRELSPWGARGLMTCQVLDHSLVQRRSSKWLVTVEEFSGQYYPTYCAGWAILYSQDVVHKLLKTAQSLPFFWIDDVHITGTCAQKAGITVTPLANLVMTWRRANLLTALGPRFISRSFLFGPTDISPSRITKIWKAICAMMPN